MEAEGELGARKTEIMRSPSLPNGAEVEEHEKTRLPFRSWCRHCVRGKGKQAEHRRITQEEVGPELHMDFAFMGDGESEELLTILVAKERTTRMMLMSTVVQAKSSAEFAAKKTLAFPWETGCEHVAMTDNSDNEPAMSALVRQIGKLHAANGGQRFSVEMGPAHPSASNGVVEVQGSYCVNICVHTLAVLVLCIFCTCRAFRHLEVFLSRCSFCQVFMCTRVCLPQGPLSLCLRSFL